jgi:hypothetical protein
LSKKKAGLLEQSRFFLAHFVGVGVSVGVSLGVGVSVGVGEDATIALI